MSTSATWQERLHHIKTNLTKLASEDCELLERHLIWRAELHRIECAQRQIQEQREQLKTEIRGIETELGLKAQ